MLTGWYNEPLFSYKSAPKLPRQIIILHITALINQTRTVLIEIHRFYSLSIYYAQITYRDIICRSHESLWRFMPRGTRRAFQMKCFLKSSPFIFNCPYCTFVPFQVLIVFAPRRASFLSLTHSFSMRLMPFSPRPFFGSFSFCYLCLRPLPIPFCLAPPLPWVAFVLAAYLGVALSLAGSLFTLYSCCGPLNAE